MFLGGVRITNCPRGQLERGQLPAAVCLRPQMPGRSARESHEEEVLAVLQRDTGIDTGTDVPGQLRMALSIVAVEKSSSTRPPRLELSGLSHN